MAEQIDDYFTTTVAAMATTTRPGLIDHDRPVEAGSSLSVQQTLDLFDSQLGSRHLDLVARRLRAKGEGFYTIGSSGHEGNAVVAGALRPTDPALLHYRSGAFGFPGPFASGVVRLRRQRHRDQHQDAEGVDRRELRQP
ncbi:conserved hypothetical protein [Rhodococcus jostii RHA1]|uniref:Transketolase n=1 Tax=Rhodococcus jostii (strain RHA1) TaxID=101510 RepID=Q0SJW3_RHOJR|nr:conserved hypothetical protein [Rhodococcus jostii RHA1]